MGTHFLEVLKIEKSDTKYKKYRADVLINGEIKKNIDFGDTRYQHFKDRTPLRLYSNLDHGDRERLRLYHLRHRNNNGPAGLLSKRFLW
jgi:tRNA U54 and U55 pseudouridine synthase Pus10